MTEVPNGPFFFTGNDPMSVGADLLNTVDLLANPADRLTVAEHLRAFLDGHGYPVDPVEDDDLDAIRRLREQLRAVWQAGDVATAAERVNALLARHRPHPRLEEVDGGWRIAYGDRARPAKALAEDVLAALAHELVDHGTSRLGTCDGDPCRCVFLDRSRNRSRRYCCEVCTNRAAAAAYRRRSRVAAASRTTRRPPR